MKLNKTSLALFVLTLLLAAAPLRSQQLVDGIAALVGEKIILVSDINQMAMEIARQNGIDIRTQPQVLAQLQGEALEELINVEIILLQAETDSVFVKDRDVENSVQGQLDQYLAMFGGDETVLEQYMGLDLRTLREKLYPRIKSNMLVQQMQQEKFANISVTRPELKQFYDEYRDSLPPLPERVELAHILKSIKVSDERGGGVREQLTAIRDSILEGTLLFEDAALKYSQDPGSSDRGGDLGFVSRGTFVPEFEKAAYGLSDGEISEPVKSQFGYHIIQLLEKRGEQIHTRHILLSLESDESDLAAVVNSLSTVREKILNGADFEETARTESEDPNVQENSGYLGEFSLNTMQIQAFAEAIKNMSPGEISTPFQSEYGVHIVKLINRKVSENIDLYKHYNIVESMLLNRKQQEFWDRWLMGLRDDYYVEKKL